MSSPTRTWPGWTALLMGGLVVLTEDIGAQQGDAESPAVFGQPAGWSIEPDEVAPLVTIVEGSTLYLEPDPASRVLAMLPESQLPLMESRAPWVQVRYGDQIGWVDLETPRQPSDVVITRPPSPDAIRFPDGDWFREEWGPYHLYSQVLDRRLLDYLVRVAEGHAQLYIARFGLHPKQEIGGAIVFLESQEAFLAFQRNYGHEQVEAVGNAYFFSPDIVVMYPGRKSKSEMAATLIHELTHLLNWQMLRELGQTHTPLPPWLDEGMADDLALSLQGRKGELAAEPLGRGNLHYGPRLASILQRLVSDLAPGGTGSTPRLEELMTMNQATFLAAERERHYLLSSLWVRYLLSGAGDQVARKFEGYLVAMVHGGSPHPDELILQLGREPTQLENGFRVWLTQQLALFGL